MKDDYTQNPLFWKRLWLFIDNVETEDLPGEEEKEMILNVCDEKIKELEEC